MSSDPGDFTGRTHDRGRRSPGGAQGASRGGFQPSGDTDDDGAQNAGPSDPGGHDGGFSWSSGQSQGRQWSPPAGGRGGSRRGGATFLGLPVNLIYAIGAAIITIVIVGAVCGKPTATGSVAGQIKALNADRTVTTLTGAQVVLRGNNQTYTATSTDVPANADGEAAYNYHIENVPPGNYTMAVTPPAGASLQSEQDISFKVESGQLFPQSVMLLADGIQKPRPLAQNELQPGEAGGYVNDRGERVVYQQGSGFDATDALLLYLLWRNPGGYGYGYPPVIVTQPGGSTIGSGSSYNYRVENPPTQSRSGQTVTQRKPDTPGQGATRPSSSTGATGSGPSYSSGPSTSGSSGSGSSSSSGGQTRPSTSSGSGSSGSGSSSSGSRISAPSVPSQGASRPSSSSSSPSRSSAPSRSSGSSGGGRR
jgi:hypothetical protein